MSNFFPRCENGNARWRKMSRFPMRTMSFAALALMLSAAQDLHGAPQDESLSLEIRFRNGTVLHARSADIVVSFRQVSVVGEISELSLPLSKIRRVRLTTSTAGELVASILRLVDELGDNDYHTRNNAETELVERGLPYLTLLEQHSQLSEPEARYRLARVIDHLKHERDDRKLPAVLEFDQLELADGSVLEGDLGQLDLGVAWRGQPLKTDRSLCEVILVSAASETTTPAARETPADRTLTSIDNFLTAGEPRSGIRFVNFETMNGGVEIGSQLKDPVNGLFDRNGCLFSCDTPSGVVVISPYKFRQGISRKNSIANRYPDPEKGSTINFKGQMRIRFCDPDHPSIPAAVHAAGANMEITRPKEKTVIEAFNSAGHVIGTAMSSRSPGSFVGLSSGRPIVALRASHNYYLYPQLTNDDFAIDDLCFEEPVPAPELNPVPAGNTNFVVVTRNEERLVIAAPRADGQALGISLEMAPDEQAFDLPLEEIDWLLGPQSQLPACAATDRRAMMLVDGSVVHVPLEGLACLANSDLVLENAAIIGCWNASVFCRYPLPSDFEKGNTVVALPLHRVAGPGEVDWSANTATLQLDKSTTLRQAIPEHEVFKAESPAVAGDLMVVAVPLNLSDPAEQAAALARLVATTKENAKSAEKQAEKEDAPAVAEMPEMTVRISEISNVWLAVPPEREAGTGLLRLNDGQQFVLGGKSGFVFKSISSDEIVIAHGEHELRFPMSALHALQFPPH